MGAKLNSSGRHAGWLVGVMSVVIGGCFLRQSAANLRGDNFAAALWAPAGHVTWTMQTILTLPLKALGQMWSGVASCEYTDDSKASMKTVRRSTTAGLLLCIGVGWAATPALYSPAVAHADSDDVCPVYKVNAATRECEQGWNDFQTYRPRPSDDATVACQFLMYQRNIHPVFDEGSAWMRGCVGAWNERRRSELGPNPADNPPPDVPGSG
jgi:hypothetical protein